VVAKINVGINAVMTTPESADFLSKHGAIPEKMSVEEFSKLVSSELARWQQLAKSHNIVAN
jgi:tripartite-type tricarboxylate transporter receptor subunit TctC